MGLPCALKQHLSWPTFTTSPRRSSPWHIRRRRQHAPAGEQHRDGSPERGGKVRSTPLSQRLFVPQVAEPHLNGPVRRNDHPARCAKWTQQVICRSGPSSRAATIAAFEGMGLDLIPGKTAIAARGRARRVRCPGAYTAIRHLGVSRCAVLRPRLRAQRRPPRSAHFRDDREHASAVPVGMEEFPPDALSVRRQAPAACKLFASFRARRHVGAPVPRAVRWPDA